MKEYGYLLARILDYQEDNVMPLCLTGDRRAAGPANLWPKSRFGEWSRTVTGQECAVLVMSCEAFSAAVSRSLHPPAGDWQSRRRP